MPFWSLDKYPRSVLLLYPSPASDASQRQSIPHANASDALGFMLSAEPVLEV